MLFHCEKSILSAAAGVASRAAALRNAQPALEGLLIQAEQSIRITGYDLSVGIVVETPANIERPGAVIMPTKMFLEILRKLPDEIVSLSVDEQLTITICCGPIEFNLPGLSPNDFPSLPEIDREHSIVIKQSELRAMLSRVTYALSDNDARIVNTGALFDVSEHALNIVALDGYRLALRYCAVTSDQPFDFIVPGDSLRELEKILDENGEAEVTLVLGRRFIYFFMEKATLVSRLLEGKFLNYKNAIPAQQKYQIKVCKKDLLAAVERVSLLIHEKIRSPVQLTFSAGRVTLFCQTALGRGHDVCPTTGEMAEELVIGFNNRYLIDALRASDDEEIILHLTGSLNPCVIRPAEGDGYVNMVLPTRLRGD